MLALFLSPSRLAFTCAGLISRMDDAHPTDCNPRQKLLHSFFPDEKSSVENGTGECREEVESPDRLRGQQQLDSFGFTMKKPRLQSSASNSSKDVIIRTSMT